MFVNKTEVLLNLSRQALLIIDVDFHLLTQIDTSFVLSLLLTECQDR